MDEEKNINQAENSDTDKPSDNAAVQSPDASKETPEEVSAPEETDACKEEEQEEQEEQEKQEEQEEPKKLGKLLKYTAFVSVGLATFSLVMRICLSKNPGAGELFYRYVTRYLQAIMAKLTSFIPFSLAETVLLLLPLFAVMIIVFAIYRFAKRDTYRLKRYVVCIFIAICLIFSNFVLNLSILYCRPSLSELCGIDDSDITADELCAASFYAAYKLDEIIAGGNISFDKSGASICPYGFEELDRRIDSAFDAYADRNDWISPYGAKAKIIALSDYMTYTHISGIYTQYTGEANINVNYPDYVVCSTIAHEKAHQRGIAPEDEANLVAFFVLAESEDDYLRYCGYMSIFSNLTGDCYIAAPEFYAYNIAPLVPQEVLGEFNAYSSFFVKYRNSEASKKTNAVNNAYLKLNGDSNGTLSYDMVSGMAAKYILGVAEKELSAE